MDLIIHLQKDGMLIELKYTLEYISAIYQLSYIKESLNNFKPL